jgi:Tfp pilus assembly protein PilZ
MKRQRVQRHPRFTKRLEVKFTSGRDTYKGILSNLSQNGLFIRTNRGFAPGTTIDIQLMMPDGTISFLKGIVRWASKTHLAIKNGMGIELLEKDTTFMDFIKDFHEKTGKPFERFEREEPKEFHIVACSQCGVKNKVRSEKISYGPKCGRCGTPLIIDIP